MSVAFGKRDNPVPRFEELAAAIAVCVGGCLLQVFQFACDTRRNGRYDRMASRVKALINHDVLVWARESSGLSLEAAAKKSSVDPEALASWEEGVERPSVPQLRKLGKAYKRPIAVFYLPGKPVDFQPLRDFRKLHGGVFASAVSPELGWEIRRAQQRRELAAELWKALDGSPPPALPLAASFAESSEEVGAALRRTLGVTFEEQVAWPNAYAALASWRQAFERNGVLVFQTTGVSIEEARGFSLSESPFPAVVVNSKDAPNGRIFTMFHELAHVLLNAGGLCDLDDRGSSEKQRVEAFCNQIAAAALLPREPFLRDRAVIARPGRHAWTLSELERVARRVSVSREAVLRRLLTLGRTTKNHYESVRAELLRHYAERAKEATGGPVTQTQKVLNRCGTLYTSLVLGGYHERKISASAVPDFLEVRLKHVESIERALAERRR